MKPTLGTAAGRQVAIDVDALVKSRMLMTANSGAGKSWALRRLLEQTHGRIQQIVLDPEGEFYTLRERFDYILAGKGGDCAAEPRSAALLARKLLELGTSAVLDLYELAPRDRVRFVRLFLEALIDAPRSLWHPVLVVLDEAHAFAPESGHGQAESLEAVARLMSQGRKRGFAGVLATQRFSKLAKDVAAEANNLLIGRAALDVDLKRVADALGLAKGDWPRIRGLRPGHFFAFGPALSEAVVEVEVGPVETAHPKAGGRAAPPAPPREKVRSVLAQLADLPAEAEAEARTAAELAGKVRQLERDLATARRAAPDADALERARREGRHEVASGVAREAQQQIAGVVAQAEGARRRAAAAIDQAAGLLKVAADALREPIDVPELQVPRGSAGGAGAASGSPGAAGPRGSVAALRLPRTPPAPAARSATSTRQASTGTAALSARCGEGRMLAILATYYPAGLPEGQWAALAGLKRSGGTWSTYKSRLRTAGYLEERGGIYCATEAGMGAAGAVPAQPATIGEVLDTWASKPGMRPVMPLVEAVIAHGAPLPREELAQFCGLTASGGTFSTYLSRARTAGLIADGSGGLVPGAAFEGLS